MGLPSRRCWCGWLVACLVFLVIGCPADSFAAAGSTAIVLVTAAGDDGDQEIRRGLVHQLQQQFPGREIRWAALPDQEPVGALDSPQPPLPALSQVLAELKAQGVTQVVVQPLAVLPGGAWEGTLGDSRTVAGLKIAVGQPLLGSLADRRRLLTALAKAFTATDKDRAVLLAAFSGDKQPAVLREYLALYTLLLASFKGSNLYFGTSNSLPAMPTALAAVKKSPANSVVIVPLPAFIDSRRLPPQEALAAYQADLAAAKSGTVQVFTAGLGRIEGISAIYVDHAAAALETLAPKKPAKKKADKK